MGIIRTALTSIVARDRHVLRSTRRLCLNNSGKGQRRDERNGLLLKVRLAVPVNVQALKIFLYSNEPHFTFVPGVIDPQKGIAYGSYDVSDFNLTG